MESHNTPAELRERVVEYLTFVNSSKCIAVSQEDKLLSPLSHTLRDELRMAVYTPWLQRNALIRTLPEEFVSSLALQVCRACPRVLGRDRLSPIAIGARDRPHAVWILVQVRSFAAAAGDVVVSAADAGVTETMYVLLSGAVRLCINHSDRHGHGLGHSHGGMAEEDGEEVRLIRNADRAAVFGAYELFPVC